MSPYIGTVDRYIDRDVTDDLDMAAAEAAAIMTAEKCRTAERLHILKEDETL